MAFPQTQLPIVVEIAPGGQPADDPDVWEPLWVNVTADVRVDQGVTIEQGRPDEANQVDPGKASLTLNNRAGTYSPRNPNGTYYGLLRKNTPLRVRMTRLTDTFTRTVSPGWGTSDNGIVWNSSNAAYSTDGSRGVVTIAANTAVSNTALASGAWDFVMTGVVTVSAVSVGGDWGHYVNFRRASSSYQYQMLINFSTAGTVGMYLIRIINGAQTTVTSNTSALATYAGNTQYSFKLKADGGFIAAKVWPTAGTEPSTWNVSSSTQGAYGIENSGLGTGFASQSTRFAGNTSTAFGTWDSLAVNAQLFIGLVAEWPVRWDKSANDSTAPVSAAGVLRRLQQGDTPLKSPLYATIYGQSPPPAAYWPLEDDSGSTSALGVGPGVKPASVYSASFGFDSTTDPQLLGASSTIQITQDTTISGVIPRTTLSGAAWLWVMAIYTPAWPPGATVAVPVKMKSSGTAVTWAIQFANVSGGQLYAIAYDADGNILSNISGLANFTPGAWHILQLESWQNGGNVSNLVRVWNLTTGVQVATSDVPFAGSVGQLTGWSVYGDSTAWSTGSVGHFAFFNRKSVFDPNAIVPAGQGYTGETAKARMVRLCAEQSVRLDVVDSPAGSAVMGRQTSDTFLNLLREAEATDLGVLSEFSGGLRYRTRDRRYDQVQRLALDFSAGNVAEAPEPTDDDQRVRNDWTVSRKEGSAARVTDDTHIAAQGRYDDSIEINPSTDAALLNQAAFRVYLGTYDDLRWPAINIDLAHNPELTAAVLSLEVGTVLTVANPPANLPVGTLRLIVEAITHTLTPFGWDVEITCDSNNPWRMAVLDDTALRLDSAVSTLGSSATSSATSLSVARTAGAAYWGTDVPFDIDVAGEQCTVTAVTGTTSPQVFTVTRAVNGIVKAHPIGDVVRLFRTSYVAL